MPKWNFSLSETKHNADWNILANDYGMGEVHKDPRNYGKGCCFLVAGDTTPEDADTKNVSAW